MDLYFRFLVTEDFYKTISFSYRLGISTISKIVIETCKAIVDELMSEFMPPPTEEKWIQIANEFWNMWNFPNCLGALNGKHVVIQAPCNSGSEYFNYKKTFSIVLMALVDAHNKFIMVGIGSYGKNSDGGIFAHSAMGKTFEMKSIHVPSNVPLPNTNIETLYVIIRDEAFPLKPYLLRPYPKKQLDDYDKRIFNYRLSRTRRVVENAFSILTQRKNRIYNRRI